MTSTAQIGVQSVRVTKRRSWYGRFFAAYATPITRIGALLVFLLVWELVYRLGFINPLFTSSPSRIAEAGYKLFTSGEIWNDLAVSGTEFAVGYLAAIAVAVPLGLAAGWYDRLFYVLNPFVDTLNAVPRITFMPIIVIWFGIGMGSKIGLVFLGAVVTIMINTIDGVKKYDARLVRVSKSFGASEFKTFRSVVLPGTVPFIFSGLKIGAGQAFQNVIVGEFYAATVGIGHFIAIAGSSFNIDQAFAGMVVVTIMGLLTVGILHRVEQHFERWRPRVGAM